MRVLRQGAGLGLLRPPQAVVSAIINIVNVPMRSACFANAGRYISLPFLLTRSCVAREAVELPRIQLRNCPKRGMSNTPNVDLAAIRMAKWAEKCLLGGP